MIDKRLDLVSPQLDAVGELLVGRPALDHVAFAHAGTCRRDGSRSLRLDIVNVDQLHEQRSSRSTASPNVQRHHHLEIVFRRAQAVNAAHAGHDDHVPAAHQRTRGHQPQPVDRFIDRGVLLDVDVPLRNVRFRLVIVVIADEVGDGVVRKEVAKLGKELGRQGLVVARAPAWAAGFGRSHWPS